MKGHIRRLKKISTPLIVIVLAIAAAVVIAEISLRLFFPQPNFHLVEYRDEWYFANKPNYDDSFAIVPHSFELQGRPIRQYVVRVRTNSVWMRTEKEVSLEKGIWTRRLLLLGDSLGFGFPLDASETFAELVEKSIPNLEVDNVSYVGAHPATSWKAYETEWKKYAPDVIVLQGLVWSPVEDHIFVDQAWSDFQKIEFLKNSGLSTLPLDKDVAMNPILRLVGSDADDARKIIRKERESRASIFSFSHVYRLVQAANFIIGRRDSPPSQGLHPTLVLKARPMERDYSKTLAYIRAFYEDSVARSAKFLFILIPNRMGCISSTHDDWVRLLRVLEGEGVAYLDFYDEFCTPYKEGKESVFLDQEIHINAQGHAAIAKRIEEALSRY